MALGSETVGIHLPDLGHSQTLAPRSIQFDDPEKQQQNQRHDH